MFGTPHRPLPGDEILAASMDARSAAETPSATEVRSGIARVTAASRRGDPHAYEKELRRQAALLWKYLMSFRLEGAPPDLTPSYVSDAFGRFLHTLDVLPIPLAGNVLEIGANPYLFHLLLKALHPQAHVEGANFFDHDIFSESVGVARHRISSEWMGESHEFEYPTFNVETTHPYPYPDGRFELVLFCETLEHLVVNPLRVFRELRRIIRPGGRLLITLPNALRTTNVAAMLAGRNFFDLYWVGNGVHGRHNREFSLAEVVALLRRDGYLVERAETRDRFDYDRMPIEATDYSGPSAPLPFRKSDIGRILESSGGTLTDRGDNIYVVARVAERRGTSTGAADPKDDPRRAPQEVADSDRLLAYVDRFEDRPDRLVVEGWAFLTDDVSAVPATVQLVLRGNAAGGCRTALPVARGDVARAHGLATDDVGFLVELEKPALQPGRYRISLRVETAAGAAVERVLAREITVG